MSLVATVLIIFFLTINCLKFQLDGFWLREVI